MQGVLIFQSIEPFSIFGGHVSGINVQNTAVAENGQQGYTSGGEKPRQIGNGLSWLYT